MLNHFLIPNACYINKIYYLCAELIDPPSHQWCVMDSPEKEQGIGCGCG